MPKGADFSLKTRRELDPLLETWNKRDQLLPLLPRSRLVNHSQTRCSRRRRRRGRRRPATRWCWRPDIATENPESPLDLNPRPIHFQQRNSGGSAESLDTSTNPSRDEIVEVTEFMQVKPHPRPLERARARYAARTGKHTVGKASHRSKAQKLPPSQ